MRRAGIATGALAVALVAGALVTIGREDEGSTASATGPPLATAQVERRDLIDRETVSGILGYGAAWTLKSGTRGTLTAIRGEGAVVGRGGWLYEVDGARTGWLMHGRRPAWRAFNPWMSDGPDVRQLERNLKALGCDPGGAMSVDGDWTSATSAAVIRFQRRRGLEQDATLDPAEIVFRPGPARVGTATAAIGDAVGAGAPLFTLTGTRRAIDVDLPTDRRSLARAGARVEVTLPGGVVGRGRITRIGRVAEAHGDDEAATIAVRVALLGGSRRARRYDRAPVDVAFERERVRSALTVPVSALLARPGGGYAVEIAEGGRRRLVSVRAGLTADGLVAIEGEVRDGEQVIVP